MPCNSRQQQPQQQQKPTHARVLKSVQACHLALGGGDIAIVIVVASLRLPTAAADCCRSCAFAAFFFSAAVVVAAFTLFNYCLQLLLLLLLRRLRSSSPPSPVLEYRLSGIVPGRRRRATTRERRAATLRRRIARSWLTWRTQLSLRTRQHTHAATRDGDRLPPQQLDAAVQQHSASAALRRRRHRRRRGRPVARRVRNRQSGWLPGIAKKQPMRSSPPHDASEWFDQVPVRAGTSPAGPQPAASAGA